MFSGTRRVERRRLWVHPATQTIVRGRLGRARATPTRQGVFPAAPLHRAGPGGVSVQILERQREGVPGSARSMGRQDLRPERPLVSGDASPLVRAHAVVETHH